MRGVIRAISVVAIALAESGCGLSIPQIPEVWDLAADTDATQHMEKQIKQAIYCEVRDGAIAARAKYKISNDYQGHDVSTASDQPVPDSWGVQLTLTFTVDESSKLNPGASLIWPYKKPLTSDTFTAGVGGQLSSDATRTDKYDSFYTLSDLTHVYSTSDVCHDPPKGILGPHSHSSPFVILSDLGIKEWLPEASIVSAYLRSSRQKPNGEGPPLGGSFASDSFSYDVKFVIVSDANATPTWKLVRVATPSSPALIDTSRTRTHELLITIGPGTTTPIKDKHGNVIAHATIGPSLSASNSHLAQEIGNAVATALRPAINTTGITVP
jgi:hypothetical protein